MTKVFDIPLVLNRKLYVFNEGDTVYGYKAYGGWYVECKDGSADYYLVLPEWVVSIPN